MSIDQLVVLFSDSANNDPLRVLQAAGFPVLDCRERSDFQAAYSRGSYAVLQTDAFRPGGLAELMVRDLPDGGTPLVVVTGRTSVNLRALAGLATSGIVYYDEVRTKLVATLERIGSAAYLQEVEARLRAACGIATRLRGALCHACQSPDPVISVTRLAALERCDRSTLYRAWGRLWGEDELTLDQFLDWLLLLRALPRKRAGQTWASLAAGLSVSERTLARTTRRILGLGLRSVDAAAFDDVRAKFEAAVMLRLTAQEA